MNHPSAFDTLFVSRTHHVPLIVGPEDSVSGSRIGGAAPACFDTRAPACPCCGAVMLYYLTLDPVVEAEMSEALSVFYCSDFECLLRSTDVQDKPALVALGHPASARSTSEGSHHAPFEGRSLLEGSLTLDFNEYRERVQGSKRGGEPGLIQGWDVVDNVEALNGLSFLFQFDEDSIPDDMDYDEAPFAFGSIYIFAHLDAARAAIDVTRTVAFWQSL